MRINAHTLEELTPAEAAYLRIPLYGQAIYGQAVYMSRAEAQRRLDEALRRQRGTIPMSNDNRISTTLAAEAKASILHKYDEIRALMTLVRLEPEDKGISVIGTARAGMHDVFGRHIANHPEFLPGWATVEEINKDLNYNKDLADILAIHNELGSDMGDTMALTSHEDLMVYLAYYSNVKDGVLRKVTAAATILPDLEPFFPTGPKAAAKAAAKKAAAKTPPSA